MNLKSLIWKPNQKVCGRIFFYIKLCSFVIFADTEFPSDFRRRFSTGLSKVYPECSVESYQQKHTFGDLSNFLHVFGLSVKKMRTVGEKAPQELQMRNLCIWMIFWEKQRLLLGKLFPPFSNSRKQKFGNLIKKFRQFFPKRILLFQPKILLENYFFLKIMFFFTFFRHWVICSPSLCRNFAVWISRVWSENPTKRFVGESFFI